MILGISGKKRVGKDTLGHYLELIYGFQRVSFANRMKEVARQLGWDGKKDTRGRQFLQELGMAVQHYDQMYWTRYAMKHLEELQQQGYKHFAFTDLRFPHEAKAIKAGGGFVVRIRREDEINTDPHVSENALDDWKDWDYEIRNVKDRFEYFYKQIDEMIQHFNVMLEHRGCTEEELAVPVSNLEVV